MTITSEDKKLTLEKLQALIATVGGISGPVEADSDLEVAEYDWTIPHHFNPEQLAALDTLGARIAEQIGETFAVLCPGEFDVTVTSIEQGFANTMAEAVSSQQQGCYFIPFTEGDNAHCGFASISPQTAGTLVGHMLRDTEGETEEDRKFSQLEESILLDITISLIDVFANTLKENGTAAVRRASQFVKNNWPVDFRGTEDLCTISFSIAHPNGPVDVAFTIISDVLNPAVGIRQSQEKKPTAEQLSNLIMERLYEAPVKVVAQLCSASIALSDMVNVAPGDVLLLGNKTDKPFKVLLNGKPSLWASPAALRGKYALVMTNEDTE
jgi:flagellar motor switch protein FliM